jgi:hypothetical protein
MTLNRITFRRCNFEKELERLAERLTGRKCVFEDAICNEPVNIEFIETDISVCKKHAVHGYAIVENPEFWSSIWWRDTPRFQYKGKYVVFKVDYASAVWLYTLLRVL